MLSVPGPTHAFVGRDDDMGKISDLLDQPAIRILTLTGPGGIGKTRLATESVRRWAQVSGARIFWARLGGLDRDAQLDDLERQTASEVIDADFSGRSAWEALVDTLAHIDEAADTDRQLLVLDTCEHVLLIARQLIVRLLESVPALTIMTTSRGPLGIVDEYLLGVPPLSNEHALTLFGELAESLGRPLRDEEQTRIAGEICQHVHNHPRFIQVAASRLLSHPLQGIRDDLTGRSDDKRLQWSSDAREGVDPRHRGVTDVMAWSRDLCSESERLLFDRLAVFAPGHDARPTKSTRDGEVGADLDAIEMICSGDTRTDGTDRAVLTRCEIRDNLDRLCDQSMVTRHITTSAVRYSLTESDRLYAWACLQRRSRAEAEETTRRHLSYYRDRVSEARLRWYSPDEQDVLDWSKAAWDNIITAIETAITMPGNATVGLEICLGLIELRVPFLKSSMRDIRRWTQRCLDASAAESGAPVELQIAARAAMAWLAVRQGQSAETDRLIVECVDACIAQPDTSDWRELGEDLGFPPQLDLAWGTALFMDDRDPRAVEVLLRAGDKFERAGNGGAKMMAGMFAGLAAATLGSPRQARTIAAHCLDSAREAGAPWAISWAELSWGTALLKDGDPGQAADVLRGALKQQVAVGDQWGASWSVELLTWALAHQISGHTEADKSLATEIAYLAGGVKKLRARLGINIASMGTFADESANAQAVARKTLGKNFQSAKSEGEALRAETGEVYQVALGALPVENRPPANGRPPWYSLTSIERDVAMMAAAGWTNNQIAVHRGKGKRTIDAQMNSILGKLLVRARTDIIDHIPPRLQYEVEKLSHMPMKN
ncbi:MAG: hypothetical protein J2P17_00185 [Mycobacterium sp.]|nr:hypothetical protein [Mycobacterium sp.]